MNREELARLIVLNRHWTLRSVPCRAGLLWEIVEIEDDLLTVLKMGEHRWNDPDTAVIEANRWFATHIDPQQAPENVRAIVKAMTVQALARCEQEGHSVWEFCVAMQTEQRLHPPQSSKGGSEGVIDLFERVFRRLSMEVN